MSGSARLEGRVAVVTGGSRGIGRAIAVAMADAGAHVVIASRSIESCERVAIEVRDRGGSALAVAAHVGRPAAARALVDAAMSHFGALDILVNNAATNPQFGPLADADEAAVLKTFDVNLMAPLRISQAAATAMKGGSVIINIASINGLRPEPPLGAYGASKAALIHMTGTLGRELGPRGIRVNAIAPGLVRTRFAQALLDNPQVVASVLAATPLGRIGEPEDIAPVAVFLASDAARFITGQVLVVDGGATI